MNFNGFGSSQGVREQLGGTRHHFAEDALVSRREMIVNLCHGGAKPDAVVEVVVRLDHLRDALAGHECIDHLEDRLECGIRRLASTMVMWSSNSKNVLPFRNHTWSATFIGFRFALPPRAHPAVAVPNALTPARSGRQSVHRRCCDRRRACSARRCGSRWSWRSRSAVECLLRHVAGECGSIRDVPEVGVRADVADPRGEIRCPFTASVRVSP